MFEMHCPETAEIANKLAVWQERDELWMKRAEMPSRLSRSQKARIRKDMAAIDDYWPQSAAERRSLKSQLNAIDGALHAKCLPPHVAVKYCAAIRGKGLYAMEDIAPGQLIGLYSGVLTRDEDTVDGNRYLFGVGGGCSIDAACCGNYTRAINNTTGRYANADAYKIKLPGCHVPQIAFLASKQIRKGQQILFSYGRQYFAVLKLKPLPLTPDTP